jgi:Chaperone of endosialidase
MLSVARSVFVLSAGLLFATAAWAQPAQQAVFSSTAVDRVFQINGVYRPADGKAAAAVESVTLSIYAEASGGTPLWQETQSLAVDSQGRYAALLGLTTDGLPVDLFASGEPRWLGLQFLRGGEAELPRTLATSVPYAMKAAKASDADTLGGLPASAFLKADGAASSSDSTVGAAAEHRIGTQPTLTAGTTGRIGKFVNTADLGDSVMTESSGHIGLGTTTPLDFMHTRFTDTTGAFTGFAVQNLGSSATSYSGMLFYDNTGALGQFQGFNNSTKEYRINNIATGGSINFMIGSTSRFLADNNGNIGISQPTPTYKLDVLHGGSTGIHVKSSSGFSVVDIDGFSGDSALRFLNNGANEWNIRNRPADNFLEIFELGSGSRLVIEDGTGRVIINSGTGTERLTVQGDIRVGTGTNGCVMDADGTVITGVCSSDLRFKKDVTPFSPTLERFGRLKPVNYFWRASEFSDKRFGTRPSYGLIAQDVQQVFPDLVTTDEQGYLAVNYSKLPLLTIQAVNELKAENDALKVQNAALEARLSALEAAIKAPPKQ